MPNNLFSGRVNGLRNFPYQFVLFETINDMFFRQVSISEKFAHNNTYQTCGNCYDEAGLQASKRLLHPEETSDSVPATVSLVLNKQTECGEYNLLAANGHDHENGKQFFAEVQSGDLDTGDTSRSDL